MIRIPKIAKNVIVLVFVSWLALGNSCSVKHEIKSLFQNIPATAQNRTTPHKPHPSNKYVLGTSSHTCSHILNETGLITTEASIFSGNQNHNSVPGLWVLFLSSLGFLLLYRERHLKNTGNPFSHSTYGPPLYLKFSRLQFYF